jgi:CheY-like chemotaxis protein
MVCCGSRRSVANSVSHTSLPKNAKHIICDDSSLNRKALRRLLMKMLGIEVDEADSEDALVTQVLKNGEYIIIWQDFFLGDGEPDGGHVARRLRNELLYKGTIIALTGYTDTLTRDTCMQAGMNHFVSKPYSSELIRQLSNQYAR